MLRSKRLRWVMVGLAALLTGCLTTDTTLRIARIVPRIDHLVVAVTDLDTGIKQIEAVTGVRALPSGAHPGEGTRNALLALGPRVYLEILAPDPTQANPRSLQSLGLSETRTSRLVGWALSSTDLEQIVVGAGASGFAMNKPTDGERRQLDGSRLVWRTATLKDERAGDGLAPFFIDWGTTEHPSVAAPTGARLVNLRAQHPSPSTVQPLFNALEIPLTVEAGAEVALIAVIETPRGRIELR